MMHEDDVWESEDFYEAYDEVCGTAEEWYGMDALPEYQPDYQGGEGEEGD